MNDERQAIDEFFDGDAALFAKYKAMSQAQFEADAVVGNDALARGDFAALRRLAHTVKSVLNLLGDNVGRDQAVALEHACKPDTTPDAAACEPLWLALRARLLSRR